MNNSLKFFTLIVYILVALATFITQVKMTKVKNNASPFNWQKRHSLKKNKTNKLYLYNNKR